jgi:hypothetical protein
VNFLEDAETRRLLVFLDGKELGAVLHTCAAMVLIAF